MGVFKLCSHVKTEFICVVDYFFSKPDLLDSADLENLL